MNLNESEWKPNEFRNSYQDHQATERFVSATCTTLSPLYAAGNQSAD